MFDNDLRKRILALVDENSEEPAPFAPGASYVPASGKVVGNRERAFMVEAALDGWLTAGRFNEGFEAALRDFLGAAHVLTVNSGSSANLVALSALTSAELGKRAIRPGDEVVTTAAGFPTTISPILHIGARPVFVDVNPRTWNADAEAVAEALSPKTRAVILAHTLGMPFDAQAVAALCRERGIWLIEDCCDALGAQWGGKAAGSFGDMATLSFYPAHHITTGEGGAVFCNNPDLARLARSFRDWGRHCRCEPGRDNACGKRFSGSYGGLPEGYDHKYVYAEAGYNLKITDMAAACGLAQMERLPGFIRARRENYAFLRERLEGCPHLRFPELPPEAFASWFGFPLLLDENRPPERVRVLKALEARGVGTRLLFAGNATRQPFMQGRDFRLAGDLAGSDRLMRSALWIGLWPGLNREMLDYSARCLRDILENASAQGL